MSETLAAAAPQVAREQKCPKCGAILPVDPGYVTWCDKCGWNLHPFQYRKPRTAYAKLYARLGERFSKQLYAQMQRQPELQARLTLSKALAFVVAGLVHGLTLLLAVLCVDLLLAGWPHVLFVVAGLFCGLLAWTLRPRLPKLPKDVELAPRESFPTLYSITDRVAQAVGAKPATLIIDEDFNASYVQVGWRRKPIVTLGLPLLTILDGQELVALLGHEMGHGANGDSNRSLFVGSAIGSLSTWYELIHPGRIWENSRRGFLYVYVGTISNIFLWLASALPLLGLMTLANLMWRDSQRAEYLADNMAARVAGTAAQLTMLDKLHYGTTLAFALQRTSLSGGHARLFDEFKHAVAVMPRREIERVSRVERMERSRLDVTHPPTAYRIDLLRARPVIDPQLVISPAEFAQLGQELAQVAPRIQAEMLDQHQSRLYY